MIKYSYSDENFFEYFSSNIIKDEGFSFNYSIDDNYSNVNIDKKQKLLNFILNSKKKINKALYIVSSKYDKIHYKYNIISLSILILSTIITFIEALRLTIINYINLNKLYSNNITLYINIITLFLGTLLTILSGIIKFKNYNIKMEKIKNIQNILFNYKCLYNKEKDLLIRYDIYNNINEKEFNILHNKIIEYNNNIKEINIFEDIRINDLLKIYKNKNNNDLKNYNLNIYKIKELSKYKDNLI